MAGLEPTTLLRSRITLDALAAELHSETSIRRIRVFLKRMAGDLGLDFNSQPPDPDIVCPPSSHRKKKSDGLIANYFTSLISGDLKTDKKPLKQE